MKTFRQEERNAQFDQSDLEFLAIVGHEMRPSLRNIVRIARLLSETPLCAKDQEYVCAILASAEMMLCIVNDDDISELTNPRDSEN